MIIGIPKEIKKHENRVGLTPAKASEFARKGHTVLVQTGAGTGSGFEDAEYQKFGCTILPSAAEVWTQADMIIKVKEPLEPEYELTRENQIIFTYFHFASCKELTDAMIAKKAICIAYETVTKDDGTLPLLIPMSEIAGRMAVQEGAKYLEKPMGGRGVLLGGVPGVSKGQVLVLGAGIVGTHATRMAAGMGANVTLMDINLARLRYLEETLPPNVQTRFSTEDAVREELAKADLVIGAVLVPGARAPRLVSRDMLKMMKPGSVVIDVAVDQGGCIETCRPTTHDSPTYVVDGVVHYCVANMPGAVPYTSTLALTNATYAYALQLATYGWKEACKRNHELKRGLNIVHGKIVFKGVAEAFNYPYSPLEEVLM